MSNIVAAVAAYWAELQEPVRYVNTSHVTLFRLERDYGKAAVAFELQKHIDEAQAQAAARERAKVRAFYAEYGITVE